MFNQKTTFSFFKNLSLFLIIVFCLFLIQKSVLAQNTPPVINMLSSVGNASGYAASSVKETSLSVFVGRIILIALSLLAVIFLVLTVFAGFLWFTAGGDEKKVDKAKEYLKNSVIGLIIILASVSITSFVVSRLASSTLSTTSTPSAGEATVP